jgi:hypothetical protein
MFCPNGLDLVMSVSAGVAPPRCRIPSVLSSRARVVSRYWQTLNVGRRTNQELHFCIENTLKLAYRHLEVKKNFRGLRPWTPRKSRERGRVGRGGGIGERRVGREGAGGEKGGGKRREGEGREGKGREGKRRNVAPQ